MSGINGAQFRQRSWVHRVFRFGSSQKCDLQAKDQGSPEWMVCQEVVSREALTVLARGRPNIHPPGRCKCGGPLSTPTAPPDQGMRCSNAYRTAFKGRRAAHWWNDEIAELRRSTIAARRRYQRAGRRAAQADRAEAFAAYNQSRKELRIAIRRSQEDS